MISEILHKEIWDIVADYVYEDDADRITERIWNLLLSELEVEE